MFGLFSSKKINVTFINNATGELLGTRQMDEKELPEVFDRSIQFHIEEKVYQIVKAEPATQAEFKKSKKLSIYIQPIEKLDPKDILFSTPTISNEIAPLTDKPLYQDFELKILEDNWRQIEFLPLSVLSVIQEEMADIEKIIFPENDEEKPGFKEIHVRKRIGAHHLSIPFNEFCELAGIKEKGLLKFWDHEGYVENGFALRSDNYTYYGTLQGDMIKELCLDDFESAETEFYQIAAQYKLVLVDWCRGQISTV